MATKAEQAQLFNEAIAQGMTEDQALAYAGITDDSGFTYNENGQLDPTVLGPPRRENETIVPAGQSIDYGDEDQDTLPPASSVQTAQVQTTAQETVTGGTERTTIYSPTVYKDTAVSSALSQEANSLQSQKEARAAQLRAEGKTGAEVLRDPEYRALSRSQQEKENLAQEAREPIQTGEAVTTTSPGSGQDYENTTPTEYFVENSSGDDPYANLIEIEQGPDGIGQPQWTQDDTTGLDDPYRDETDGGLTEFTPEDEVRWSQEDTLGLDNPYEDEIDGGLTEFTPDDRVRWAEEDTLGLDSPYEDAEGEDEIIEFTDAGPVTRTSEEAQQAAREQAVKQNARAQAVLQQQRKQANDGDWRVKLRLAPNATYLYKADDCGPVLQPLKESDGVIFPYTPQITTAYRADYTDYKLTHSNYRGFFYQSSYVEDIQIQATFTAQDTYEANYLLAVITFFKSVTKMFYGQDAQRGAPPPMVFLQGLGQYQFNLNPCVVTQFNYVLPNDVDYIRAQSPTINGTNLLNRRSRQSTPTNPFSSAASRIANVLKPQGINSGAQPSPPGPPTLGKNSPTYVPTKIDITLVLHPMQSREQVSKQFSLKGFANGDLIKGGFW